MNKKCVVRKGGGRKWRRDLETEEAGWGGKRRMKEEADERRGRWEGQGRGRGRGGGEGRGGGRKKRESDEMLGVSPT